MGRKERWSIHWQSCLDLSLFSKASPCSLLPSRLGTSSIMISALHIQSGSHQRQRLLGIETLEVQSNERQDQDLSRHETAGRQKCSSSPVHILFLGKEPQTLASLRRVTRGQRITPAGKCETHPSWLDPFLMSLLEVKESQSHLERSPDQYQLQGMYVYSQCTRASSMNKVPQIRLCASWSSSWIK